MWLQVLLEYGKSTVSRRLAEKKKKSVLLEGDEIYHHVIGSYISPWKEGNHLDVFWKVVLETINIYLGNGYDVIFNYIVGEKDLVILQERFCEYKIKFIVLMANENTIIKRDLEREEDCRMGKRAIELLQNFRNKEIERKYIIESDNLNIDEIIDIIDNDNKFYIGEKYE